MCGIAGIVRFDGQPVARDRVDVMLDHIHHRGPDGERVWYDEPRGRAAFAHARLSVIDLLSGDQPMHIPKCDSQGTLTLVFNGEIYNHRLLRRQLERLGHVFTSSHSDTEVILYGYREWGNELPKHLHGMFAFAIFDQETGELFLSRDRVGKKPLFIRWSDDGQQIMFASLVPALIRGGDGPPPIDPAALRYFLRLGYSDHRTMLQGITELASSRWLKIDGRGKITSDSYWQPPPISKTSTSVGAVKATMELIEEAVSKRLESDVPLGCFLSGGIDSSVIAAVAHRQLMERGGYPLQTFSITMPELDYDEGPYARIVADKLGTRHTELTTIDGGRAHSGTLAIDDLIRLTAITGEPTADSSILPTYWISRATRDHVKVALSGDGGDELFGGYDRYRAMRLLNRHARTLARIPIALTGHGTNPKAIQTRIRRLLHASRASNISERYSRMIELFSADQIRDLGGVLGVGGLGVGGLGVGGLGGRGLGDGLANARDDAVLGPMPIRSEDWPNEADPVDSAMRWDLMQYLPFDLLRKVDRASMAVALEVRCPLLDTQLCDLAGHLPARVLMPNGRPKGLLRAIAETHLDLPNTIVNRRKQGFAVPIGIWFRNSLAASLGDHLFCGELESLGLERKTIQRLYDDHLAGRADHSHRLFGLLSLSIWLKWLRQFQRV